MSEADPRAPPPGFGRMMPPGRFVNRAGTFYVRQEANGEHSVGTWIGEDQANSEGYAHGGFLLTFADFAITYTGMGITLNLSCDFLRAVRVGDWLEARVIERKRSSSLLFADAIGIVDGRECLRMSGLFRPVGTKA